MRLSSQIFAAIMLALATFSAHAQEQAETAPAPAAEPIELGVDAGSVLVSTGGEFTQAASGQVLLPGQRVLVSEGAAATLTYGNGCQKALATPGVYTVNGDCVTAGRSGPSAGMVAGVAGGVAILAAAAGGGGSSRPAPVSR